MAKAEFPGLWEKDQAKVRKKLYEPNLSVFEQKALEAARTRHKETMTKTQVVMGKEFKGDAFIPTPKVALFKVRPTAMHPRTLLVFKGPCPQRSLDG